MAKEDYILQNKNFLKKVQLFEREATLYKCKGKKEYKARMNRANKKEKML